MPIPVKMNPVLILKDIWINQPCWLRSLGNKKCGWGAPELDSTESSKTSFLYFNNNPALETLWSVEKQHFCTGHINTCYVVNPLKQQ